MAARQVHDDQAEKLVDLRTDKLIINPARSQKRAANTNLVKELAPKKVRCDPVINNEAGTEQTRAYSIVHPSSNATNPAIADAAEGLLQLFAGNSARNIQQDGHDTPRDQDWVPNAEGTNSVAMLGTSTTQAEQSTLTTQQSRDTEVQRRDIDMDHQICQTFNGRPLVLTTRHLLVGTKVVEGPWPAEIRGGVTHVIEARLDLEPKTGNICVSKSFLQQMRKHPGYMTPHRWPNLSSYFSFHSWFELDNEDKHVSIDGHNNDNKSVNSLSSGESEEIDVDDLIIQEASLRMLVPERSAVAELSTQNNAFRFDNGKLKYIPLSERPTSAYNIYCDEKEKIYDECATEWISNQGTACPNSVNEFLAAKDKASIWLSMLIDKFSPPPR